MKLDTKPPVIVIVGTRYKTKFFLFIELCYNTVISFLGTFFMIVIIIMTKSMTIWLICALKLA